MSEGRKIIIEISEEEKEFLEKTFDIKNAEFLCKILVEKIIAGLRDMMTALKGGVPVTLDDAHKLGEEIGRQTLEESRKEIK